MATTVLRLAINAPVNSLFDYLPPANSDADRLRPGIRIRVPFARSRKIGILMEVTAESALPRNALKTATEILDDEPLLSQELLDFGSWAARYYHHPIGEVMATMLPGALRKGQETAVLGTKTWCLTDAGNKTLSAGGGRLGSKQKALMETLAVFPEAVPESVLNKHLRNWRPAARTLAARGWIVMERTSAGVETQGSGDEKPPELSREQRVAVKRIEGGLDGFRVFLLEGVTGSGKTEVYLRLVEQILAQGRQALVLVPEIALTPQLLDRFRRRLSTPVAALHSGLGERERAEAWLAVRDGSAGVAVGTRSAVFTPLARPGIIIVDEEHDPSFKQQEGFRYSGRDLAVARAALHDVPVALGTATPSLESLHNVDLEKYHHLTLKSRIESAREPTLELVDLRREPMESGLARSLIERMRAHLAAGEQTLIFLNRRGFAPTLMCHDCGWLADCSRCDSRLTLHLQQVSLICHHCGQRKSIPAACPACGAGAIRPVGQGTERVEERLGWLFPEHPVARIDRDSTRGKGKLEALLAGARAGEFPILLGTQMLAKGHHFPQVTLVAILNADHGLFSSDYRAAERTAQIIVQVAGRAGRAKRPGHVIIQTHQPELLLLQTLIKYGYSGFARRALWERQEAGLPPYAAHALLRAEAHDARRAHEFLMSAKFLDSGNREVELWGPVPAPMERRAGRWRAQLMVHAQRRPELQCFLEEWMPQVEGLKSGRRVRWSLDVDPSELL